MKIHGVEIKKILSHSDKRGFFKELFKINEISKTKTIRQVSHSLIRQNVIKGWHLHKKQYQWNYLLKGSIKLYLFDTRKKSKTFKKYLSLKVNSKYDKLIYYFPPGVAHGYIALNKENHMIYATSGVYDPDEEYKIALNNNLIPNFFEKFMS